MKAKRSANMKRAMILSVLAVAGLAGGAQAQSVVYDSLSPTTPGGSVWTLGTGPGNPVYAQIGQSLSLAEGPRTLSRLEIGLSTFNASAPVNGSIRARLYNASGNQPTDLIWESSPTTVSVRPPTSARPTIVSFSPNMLVGSDLFLAMTWTPVESPDGLSPFFGVACFTGITSTVGATNGLVYGQIASSGQWVVDNDTVLAPRATLRVRLTTIPTPGGAALVLAAAPFAWRRSRSSAPRRP